MIIDVQPDIASRPVKDELCSMRQYKIGCELLSCSTSSKLIAKFKRKILTMKSNDLIKEFAVAL